MNVLEGTLKELIASDLHIRPENVTPDQIRRWRSTHVCAEDDTNEYGGHILDGLEHLTDEDVEAALREYEAFIAEFGPKP